MNKEKFILPKGQRPDWLEYPKGFLSLADADTLHLTPWQLMEAEVALMRSNELVGRYPSRMLFPFAFRQNNDDLACWEKGHGERVVIIHDFAESGWENEGSFDTFQHWLEAAKKESSDWE
jgi:hypothetical protein